MDGNVIVGQSGGPTSVINSSLAGVYKTAIDRGAKKVYGMLHGIKGLLDGQYVDLSEKINSTMDIDLLKRTPSSYLGSCRYKLPEISEDRETFDKIFKILDDLDIKYFFYIGGNDSMDTIKKLSDYAIVTGSDIKFMGVPKTIDNDLAVTDHTPGFGSAAKFIAATMKEIIRDGLVYDYPTVTIVEIMGRNAGWLTAAAALAKSDDYLAAFFMDDYIGGRYSSTSAVGGAVLSLAFGPEVFAQFLDGAAAEDKLATNKDVMQNPAMLDALIGVYERNVLGYPSTAVLPYSQALSRFPAHLQQLDMESNGKSVNRFGEPVDYVTGPVIFGEPGTNGQHSFYQLLHQGTDIVPLQFIGFKNSQIGTDVVIQDSTSQQKLCANVAAQIVAFACGKADENRNKNFEGGRPSSIIIGDQVTPESLGALLAHFENKVMFQGFLWNVNSFDQEGVQLGKVLAKRVLAHETDGALKVFSDLLNI